MSDAWVQALSLIVVNVLVLIGGFATLRQNRKAAAESTAVTRDTLEVTKREALVDNLSEQLDRLWPRLERMDERDAQQRERIDHLETENRDLRHHTVTCAENVDELRRRIDDYADRYRVAVIYVRKLHQWMTEHLAHLPGDVRPPAPPEGLAFDLADPMQSEHTPPAGWPPRRAGTARRIDPGVPSEHDDAP